jgi:hypothetical protein
MFSRGIPRLPMLLLAIAAFCLIPPEVLARGPNLCLWRHLFHVAACPACGSTRALVALFHGQLRRALALNLNVLVTGPTLVTLVCLDTFRWARRILVLRPSSLNSSIEPNTF